MRTAIGGTLLTLGCLLGIGALFAGGWAVAGADDALPGRGGLPALAAFGLGGWAGLFLLAGGLVLKKEPRSAVRLSPLLAGILGTLIGCGVYLLYEIRLRSDQPSVRTGDERTFYLRGFGTAFEFSGGRTVSWVNDNDDRKKSEPEGGIAKWFLFLIGITLTYGAAGGLALGGLAALAIRRDLPDQAADYADRPPGKA